MRYLFFLILITSSFSCFKKSKKHEKEKIEVSIPNFILSKSDYTILKFDKEMDWIFQNAKSTSLNENELIEIEEILKTAESENNKNNQFGEKIQIVKKKRQYVPIINAKGEKEVWINFFCYDFDSDTWKKQLFIVHDGGNCYFNIKVNLTRKSFYDLEINGYA